MTLQFLFVDLSNDKMCLPSKYRCKKCCSRFKYSKDKIHICYVQCNHGLSDVDPSRN